ncbi:SRPBCC family protein [Microbacterium sp. CPCC 204701]|uniref:SRPBCC family protein n=1 Tax=Microbacterium sp. CPCC 204701 TaxID=2493084 RepID=UPI000FDB0B33|nr:SRPBCC domain-containing protein [Microbacterium sp. CPCC 204701]
MGNVDTDATAPSWPGDQFTQLALATISGAASIALEHSRFVVDSRDLASALAELDSGTAFEALAPELTRAHHRNPDASRPVSPQSHPIVLHPRALEIAPPTVASDFADAVLAALQYADARGSRSVFTADLLMGVLEHQRCSGARMLASARPRRRRLRNSAWATLITARDSGANEVVPERPLRVEASTLIPRPQEAVWEAVTNPEKFAARMEGADVIQVRTTFRPDGYAQQIHLDGHYASRECSFVFTTLVADPPRRWSVQAVPQPGDHPRNDYTLTYELVTVSAGTHLTVCQSGMLPSPSPQRHAEREQSLQAALIDELTQIQSSLPIGTE